MVENRLGGVLGRRDADPMQEQLEQVLGDVGAGPQLVEHREELFDRLGTLVVGGLTSDESGDRLQYSLEYPNPNAPEAIERISIGAVRLAQTGETHVYVASNGQNILQARPSDEDLDEKLRDALRYDFVRRIEAGSLPPHVRDRIREVA